MNDKAQFAEDMKPNVGIHKPGLFPNRLVDSIDPGPYTVRWYADGPGWEIVGKDGEVVEMILDEFVPPAMGKQARLFAASYRVAEIAQTFADYQTVKELPEGLRNLAVEAGKITAWIEKGD